jgi:FAD/FMN-containing dehydrogenase
MIGSEGTLGVITSARLRLVPPFHAGSTVVLVGVERLAEGVPLIAPGVHAIEFFDRTCLEAVVEHHGLAYPMAADFPFYVLIEAAEPPDLEVEAPAVVDRGLWLYRESITETINQIGVPVKLDVAVPLRSLDEFATSLRRLGTGEQVFLYGHLAEGNFHVNVVGATDPERVVDEVLGLVVSLGGAIASEHGIGIAKTGWWRKSTDRASIDLARRVKTAMDPSSILNPSVFWG